jgi:YfiH family protein
MIKSETLNNTDGVQHGFFTRQGGVSSGVLSTNNCGFGASDSPENVTENRDRSMKKIGCTAEALNTVYQIHSPTAVVADEIWPLDDRPKADAIVTRNKNLAIGILTADCTPVLFADRQNGVIGAAHAGWRGALDGVLGNCVQAMESIGADRTQISAVIGPCIHQKSYEVGPEFRTAFIGVNASNAEFFVPSERDQHFQFDLPGFVKSKLACLSLNTIEDVGIDTYSDKERFFSYRRTTHLKEQDYGRGLSAIVLNR